MEGRRIDNVKSKCDILNLIKIESEKETLLI